MRLRDSVSLEVFFSEKKKKMKAKYAEGQGLYVKFSDKHTREQGYGRTTWKMYMAGKETVSGKL